jgi:hypothetical protein
MRDLAQYPSTALTAATTVAIDNRSVLFINYDAFYPSEASKMARCMMGDIAGLLFKFSPLSPHLINQLHLHFLNLHQSFPLMRQQMIDLLM